MDAQSSQDVGIMFAGPTLVGLDDPTSARRAGFSVHPPVRRGDVTNLLKLSPTVMVVVDGMFHQSLAIGHAELRNALAHGWQVWGLSSMGAIRAFEMRDYGMHGYGKVYQHFLAEGDYQDDEVALLHAPPPYCFPMSEPLLHLRYVVKALEEQQAFDRQAAAAVIAELKNLWYGDRTLERFAGLIEQYGGGKATGVGRALLADISRYRVKAQDLQCFLQEQAWRRTPSSFEPVPAPYT